MNAGSMFVWTAAVGTLLQMLNDCVTLLLSLRHGAVSLKGTEDENTQTQHSAASPGSTRSCGQLKASAAQCGGIFSVQREKRSQGENEQMRTLNSKNCEGCG